MISRDIWGIAQLLNAAICIAMFNFLAIASIPFALIGGIPALGLFKGCLWLLKKCNAPAWLNVVLSLIIIPLCTAACSFGLKYMLDDSNGEFTNIAISPVVATAIATLLNAKRLITLDENAEHFTNKYNNHVRSQNMGISPTA